MKLKLQIEDKHTELVAAVTWSPDNKLYSLSDDKTIQVFNYNGEYLEKFMDLDTYCTALEFGPRMKTGNDSLALGTSDGTLKIISRTGKIEKVIDSAHSTAIICIKWSAEGQAIATSGEDGIVKIWSRQGVLRSKLVETSSPIYAIAWSYDENYILYSSDRNLSIKPIFKGGNKEDRNDRNKIYCHILISNKYFGNVIFYGGIGCGKSKVIEISKLKFDQFVTFKQFLQNFENNL